MKFFDIQRVKMSFFKSPDVLSCNGLVGLFCEGIESKWEMARSYPENLSIGFNSSHVYPSKTFLKIWSLARSFDYESTLGSFSLL